MQKRERCSPQAIQHRSSSSHLLSIWPKPIFPPPPLLLPSAFPLPLCSTSGGSNEDWLIVAGPPPLSQTTQSCCASIPGCSQAACPRPPSSGRSSPPRPTLPAAASSVCSGSLGRRVRSWKQSRWKTGWKIIWYLR